jgi:hypothetical protein
MPNTYPQLCIRIVFAVKGRQHFIKEPFREKYAELLNRFKIVYKEGYLFEFYL